LIKIKYREYEAKNRPDSITLLLNGSRSVGGAGQSSAGSFGASNAAGNNDLDDLDDISSSGVLISRKEIEAEAKEVIFLYFLNQCVYATS
jgi:hypothetical protein